MECFYHPNASACGICKSCQRGICKECSSELENGIACKGKCEEQATALNDLVASSIKMQASSETLINKASSGIGASELFNIALGAIFTIYGISEEKIFLIILGVAFLLFGALGLVNLFKAKKTSV
mgnify:CR=1 FL=1